ncbi:hypothetical Protein YC6258_02733 [Gynuella sunshinyii YC6258]|uniref:Uncharacterized protein n=1 Tax=Gynuella sunshinyii YC6258 TaxID=1445510 RepID=A0A0C5VKH9_9GAMM|nr:hypothetical Protein YC6258_02733 [Gynuella sunshinyii YC6258]
MAININEIKNMLNNNFLIIRSHNVLKWAAFLFIKILMHFHYYTDKNCGSPE